MIINSENTEIDNLEITEPKDAKTTEELMSSSMPVPSEINEGE
jgi:hypothetical protein